MNTKLFLTALAIIAAFNIAMVVTPVSAQNATGNATTAGGNVTGGNSTTAATVGPTVSEGVGEDESYEK